MSGIYFNSPTAAVQILDFLRSWCLIDDLHSAEVFARGCLAETHSRSDIFPTSFDEEIVAPAKTALSKTKAASKSAAKAPIKKVAKPSVKNSTSLSSKMVTKSSSKSPAQASNTSLTPEAQFTAILAKRDPKVQSLFKSVRTALRKRYPTANELAYDYNHAFVVSYSPTLNGIEGILALSAKDTGVYLYFSQGPTLSDPKRLLQGAAKTTRFVQLVSAKQLVDPDIETFLAATMKQAKTPYPATGKGSLVIKTDSTTKPAKRKIAK